VFDRVAPSRSPAHDAEAAVVFDGGRHVFRALASAVPALESPDVPVSRQNVVGPIGDTLTTML
jgi:hypothetical protein